jgi:anti-sigma regulatory factor (Ser/Thr protein kinase)
LAIHVYAPALVLADPNRTMKTKPSRQPDGNGLPALRDGLLLKLQMHSDPKLLCVVRGALERLTEVLGFSASDCRSVTRAVDEALTNIIRHCYGGRLDQPIEISCKRIPRQAPLAGGLEILLSDRGPAIDPAKLRGRRLDEIKPGGLGLHFIRQSMDTVEYQRTGGVNRFRMVKYFQHAPTESQGY